MKEGHTIVARALVPEEVQLWLPVAMGHDNPTSRPAIPFHPVNRRERDSQWKKTKPT